MNYYGLETPREAALQRENEQLKHKIEYLERMVEASYSSNISNVSMELPDSPVIVNQMNDTITMHLGAMATMDQNIDGYHCTVQEYRDHFPMKVGYFISNEAIRDFRPDRLMIEMHKRLIERFIQMEGRSL